MTIIIVIKILYKLWEEIQDLVYINKLLCRFVNIDNFLTQNYWSTVVIYWECCFLHNIIDLHLEAVLDEEWRFSVAIDLPPRTDLSFWVRLSEV